MNDSITTGGVNGPGTLSPGPATRLTTLNSDRISNQLIVGQKYSSPIAQTFRNAIPTHTQYLTREKLPSGDGNEKTRSPVDSFEHTGRSTIHINKQDRSESKQTDMVINKANTGNLNGISLEQSIN